MSELEQYAGCDALLENSQKHEISIIDIYSAFCEEIEKINRQEKVKQFKRKIRTAIKKDKRKADKYLC